MQGAIQRPGFVAAIDFLSCIYLAFNPIEELFRGHLFFDLAVIHFLLEVGDLVLPVMDVDSQPQCIRKIIIHSTNCSFLTSSFHYLTSVGIGSISYQCPSLFRPRRINAESLKNS